MLIEIAEIPQEGLTVTLRAEPVVLRLLDGGPPTEAHADAVLRLTRTQGGVLAEGEVASTLSLICSRCSEPFALPVKEPFSVFYQEPLPPSAEEEVELGPEDLDTDFLAQGRLDLTALLHENLLLALPAQPLCREDCQGLCPRCGANRNEGACACAGPPADPRFAILEQLKREP
ncbi:MAG: DUF177 domain-containing protein [candidate division NC10 bacterium]|nr:DUF177 domain-containing protein [candidate division NC10 bacterium]